MTSPSVKVDLVIQFDATPDKAAKGDARLKASQALNEYNELLDTLHGAGFVAAGKQGNTDTEILVIVSCPWEKLTVLVEAERHSDFLHGLLTNAYPGDSRDFSSSPLNPADRVRLIYTYVTSTPDQGGLGIDNGAKKWPHIKSVFTLHDRQFNRDWIDSWTHRQLGFHITAEELEVVKNQYGEAIALYYSFLSSYAMSLVFPTVIGVAFWWFEQPYNPLYSIFVVFWSVGFVEWWRIRERKLAVRWGTRGAIKVEKLRVEFHPVRKMEDDDSDAGFPWYKRELRILTSLPVIGAFAVLLAILLTVIFVIEPFVTDFYTGPGHQVVSLVPTILFTTLISRFLDIYHKFAVVLTNWENHAHQSTHDASLTIKTFALSSIVAYLGLSLSAFVYAPFGEYLMTAAQTFMLKEIKRDEVKAEATTGGVSGTLDTSRLQNQMFAYMVTNQISDTFTEVGLPFILRGFSDVKSGKGLHLRNSEADEKDGDLALIQDIQYQASLPEYSLFVDYSEMVTQFGYIVLYSTIWPLAPAMCLINNWFELRSDAFKMTHHTRRPVPSRVDTIGPWLDNLAFLSWLSALINSALVYLFRPSISHSFFYKIFHQHDAQSTGGPLDTLETSIVPALLIALSASHGYIILRGIIRHVLERALWMGSEEAKQREKKERIVKKTYLKNVANNNLVPVKEARRLSGINSPFWIDDGVAQLEKRIKTE